WRTSSTLVLSNSWRLRARLARLVRASGRSSAESKSNRIPLSNVTRIPSPTRSTFALGKLLARRSACWSIRRPMSAPAVPPTAAPRMAPRAVEPVALPTAAPAAAPAPAPITAPLAVLLHAQPPNVPLPTAASATNARFLRMFRVIAEPPLALGDEPRQDYRGRSPRQHRYRIGRPRLKRGEILSVRQLSCAGREGTPRPDAVRREHRSVRVGGHRAVGRRARRVGERDRALRWPRRQEHGILPP